MAPQHNGSMTLATLAFCACASVVVAALLPGAHASIKLPSYIKACSRTDRRLNECALKSARAALPHVVKGDHKYGVQPLDPLRLTEVLLEQGRSLKLSLKDVDIIGLRHAEIDNLDINLSKKTVRVDLKIPRVAIIGKYTVDGRILVLPIKGFGKANITLDALSTTYTFEYDIIKKPDGKEYIKGIRSIIKLDAGQAHMQLDNLFNGDERLGATMNRFLNENWREVLREIQAPIEETIVQVVERILLGFTNVVTYDDFLPTSRS